MSGGVLERGGVRYLHRCRHLCDVVGVEGAGGGVAAPVARAVDGAFGVGGELYKTG